MQKGIRRQKPRTHHNQVKIYWELYYINGIHRNYKKIFNIFIFLHHIKAVIEISINVWKRVQIIPHLCERRIIKKIMHVHFYNVRETEKIQLCLHNTIHETEKFTTIIYVDITEYVYVC